MPPGRYLAAAAVISPAQAQQKRPNVVMLMSDDTGWADLGAYLGGAALGHPTPNLDQIAKEGALFTNWYGQASCTAGRASFITGRIPIRSALLDALSYSLRSKRQARRALYGYTSSQDRDKNSTCGT